MEYFSTLSSYGELILAGTLTTIQLTAISFVAAALFAVPVLVLRMAPTRLLNVPARAFIDVVRGTPLLLQLFFVYYGLPQLGVTMDAFTCAVIALAVNFGTFMAENFRGAVADLPPGQIQAAHTLGLSSWQVGRRIIFPQVFRTMLPTLVGQALTLLQGTSLVTIMSLQELTFQARYISNQTFTPIQTFAVAGAIYLALSYVISFTGAAIERHLALPGSRPLSRRVKPRLMIPPSLSRAGRQEAAEAGTAVGGREDLPSRSVSASASDGADAPPPR